MSNQTCPAPVCLPDIRHHQHPRRQLGLVQLYPDPTGLPSSQDTESSVDIIAIHGLGADGSSYVWRDTMNKSARKVHWLRDSDMLPAVIPNSRIFSYEWNAGFEQDATSESMEDHANCLLQQLVELRAGTDVGDSAVQRTLLHLIDRA